MSDVLSFLRELLSTPSLPGEEGDVARRVAAEMERLGYDEVRIDDAGNVVGLLRGAAGAPSVMLNTHLDHVDVGDPDDWPRPPFGAEVADGRVWGRGAVDIKGPLAAQVHGAARATSRGEGPPGDVYVTAVVQEEIGGLGARHLVGHLGPDLVVVGEPSSNQLRRGHRGRAELVVRIRGRSVHASAPDRGVNPLYGLAGFLSRLEDVALPGHPELGRATVAPTLVATDQASANVVPSEVRLTLDCRLVPGQTTEGLRDDLTPVLDAALEETLPGGEGAIEVPLYRRTSWTGLEVEMPADMPAYVLPGDHPAVTSAADVLAAVLERPPEVGLWGFATDGGQFAEAGHTVVGFGPGEEALAHTVDESLELDELDEAVAGYEALAARWSADFARAAGG